MGHDCCTQDADCCIQGVSAADYAGLGNEALGNLPPLRLGSSQLIPKTSSDYLHHLRFEVDLVLVFQCLTAETLQRCTYFDLGSF